MPEINPYEAPQSTTTSRATASVLTSTRGSKRLSLLIKLLTGLQVVSALLSCFFWVLEIAAHSGRSELLAKSAMFGRIFFVLGIILLLLGYFHRSISLMLVQFLVLAVAIWQMLRQIQ